MATGFSKLYIDVNRTDVRMIVNELICFFDAHGISLTDNGGLVEYIQFGGGVTLCDYEEFITKIINHEEVSFFWRVSAGGRLYSRYRWHNGGTLSEECDLGWISNEIDKNLAKKLVIERMRTLTRSQLGFKGGVMDKIGYSENFDWDSFFVRDHIVGEIEVPTMLCLKSSNKFHIRAQEIETLEKFVFMYFDSIFQ